MRPQELRLAIQATGKRLKSSHAGKAIKRMGALGQAPSLLPARATAGYDASRRPSVNTMLGTAFHALTWQRVCIIVSKDDPLVCALKVVVHSNSLLEPLGRCTRPTPWAPRHLA